MKSQDEIYQKILKILEAERFEKACQGIPVGVSNRHLHLSQEHVNILFGEGYSLTNIKDVKQPGQFACKETVTLCGPKGAIEKVRILGPTRKTTQVEILKSDCFKLGLDAPIRMSGDLEGSPGVTIVGPKGSIYLQEGVIVAHRHIHMLPEQAEREGFVDQEIVSLEIKGIRAGRMDNVVMRVADHSALECHVDIEEANAYGLTSSSFVHIIRN